MLKRILIINIFYLAVSINIWSPAFAGRFDEEKVLIENKEYIKKYAKIFNISSRLLASIIYAEQKLNVTPGEIVLDFVFAKSGYNSSLGIAQIKINTAEWIERQINNKQSPFYLSERICFLIRMSNSKKEIIEKLTEPETNILYAACYTAIILKIWGNELNFTSLNEIKTGITATLYTLGILDSNGKIRMPHPDAAMNDFGKTAQEFYMSFLMREEFSN